jgi:hypothetical protein
MSQAVEGYNFLPLAQKAMTLSFWHKHTKTGTYCVSVRNSGLDRSYVAEYTQAVTDTWELATITVTASPAAGTWLYTTGVGLWVDFTVLSGSTFQTTAGSWQSGNYSATSSQVNGLDATANNFRIALVQLEAGSVATEFESRTVQEELALCQRYYEKSFAQATVPAQAAGLVGALMHFSPAAVGGCAQWFFATQKRATPTVVTYNTASANTEWRDITNSADRAVLVNPNSENSDRMVDIQLSTSAAGAAYNYIHATAAAEL